MAQAEQPDILSHLYPGQLEHADKEMTDVEATIRILTPEDKLTVLILARLTRKNT